MRRITITVDQVLRAPRSLDGGADLAFIDPLTRRSFAVGEPGLFLLSYRDDIV